MFDWIWNVHQDRRMAEARTDARRDTDATTRRVESLEREVARLSLSCGALWSLLRERHGMTDTDLADRIETMDLRGATRSSPPPAMRACKSCGRSVRADRRWCLYCGAAGGSDLDGPTA